MTSYSTKQEPAGNSAWSSRETVAALDDTVMTLNIVLWIQSFLTQLIINKASRLVERQISFLKEAWYFWSISCKGRSRSATIIPCTHFRYEQSWMPGLQAHGRFATSTPGAHLLGLLTNEVSSIPMVETLRGKSACYTSRTKKEVVTHFAFAPKAKGPSSYVCQGSNCSTVHFPSGNQILSKKWTAEELLVSSFSLSTCLSTLQRAGTEREGKEFLGWQISFIKWDRHLKDAVDITYGSRLNVSVGLNIQRWDENCTIFCESLIVQDSAQFWPSTLIFSLLDD